MAVRANISKGYIWRPGLIGAAALAMSIWFFYDGTVKYPLQQQQWKEYSKITQNYTDPNEAGKAWEQLANEKGWPAITPTKREAKDIFTQKLLSGITAPIGLYFLAVFLMSLGRWVEADERGLRTKNGKETDYNSITSIDETRWKSKGIAVVHYTCNGQTDRILLDDWKFEREPTKRIFEAIKERLPGSDNEDAGIDDTDAIVNDDQTEST